MKLYFWDWHDSLKIQMVEMEMPWSSNDEAAAENCYTNLQTAITSAKIDLRQRIADAKLELDELEKTYFGLYSVNSQNVEKVSHIRGLV